MAEPMDSSETGTSAVAVYVATKSADLAAMTQRTGLETLSYLLEMVRSKRKTSPVTRPDA
jgi:hypothetical protein